MSKTRAFAVICLTLAVASIGAMAAVPSEYAFTNVDMAGNGGRAVGDYFGTVQYQNPAGGGVHMVDVHRLNDNGVVVGEFVQDNIVHGFRGSEDMGRMVGNSNGAYLHYVSNINNNNTVVGQYTVTGGASSWRPFVADTAWGTGLPTFLYDGITDNARPSDINDDGYIVGQIFTGGYQAVLWEPATRTTAATNITYANSVGNSRAAAINEARSICGVSDGGGSTPRQGYWRSAWVTGAASTSATFLDAPEPYLTNDFGNLYMVSDDINESGTVVGAFGASSDGVNATPFVWVPDTANGTTSTTGAVLMTGVKNGDGTGLTAVGPYESLYGRPNGINDAGLAVGWVFETGAYCRSNAESNASFGYNYDNWYDASHKAFIWDTAGGTEGVYLETLLPQADQDLYHLLVATDINDDDQVTVTYKLEADITSLGFVNAPIYSAILDVNSGPVLVPGDCDGDGDVDLTDLAILASNYGSVEPPALEHGDGDFDDDGDVDLTDLAILANNWGFGTMTAVPEPATMSLIALGGVAMIRRRR